MSLAEKVLLWLEEDDMAVYNLKKMPGREEPDVT